MLAFLEEENRELTRAVTRLTLETLALKRALLNEVS
jgi:hypothetical protein